MKESWKMFDQIAPTYDRLNRILSLGIDSLWRRRLVQELPKRPLLRLLDCATGTGDQLIACLKRGSWIAQAVGIDLAEAMLALAEKKIEKTPFAQQVAFKVGSATQIPFPESSFDCVSMSFAVRNVGNVPQCLAETFRVLSSGGRVLILEFSLPTNPVVRFCYLLYLRHLLPPLGGLLSGNPRAYRYLNETIEVFPYGEPFCSLLRQAGFIDVAAHPLTGGIATLYVGNKR